VPAWHSKHYLPIVLLLLAFGTLPASAQDSNAFVVRNVRVFDGERAIDRQTVVVVDGNIATIGGARVAAPHGARSIERRTPSML
jgi:hypothetical protein